jgi:hypothetical protein
MVTDGSSVIAETSTGDYTALQVYYSFVTLWFCFNTERRGFITVTHGEFQAVPEIRTKMLSKEHCEKQLKKLA